MIADDERLASLVATAQKGATRGAQLTGQLLAFARRQTLRPETRPINHLLREFDVLASRMLGEAIQVDFLLAPEAGACEADPAQFGAALLNLVVNARDAMPNGGRLAITTGNVTLDARAAARNTDARPGKYVLVEVVDTGTGMPTEVLGRATEPFFSTKEVGQGTGLGLSQVYGFVRQSGGFLTIESTLDVGTRVRIHLPEVESRVSESSRSEDVQPGTGVILVVEDDADVRQLVAAQLEGLGYQAVLASTGPEALEAIASSSTPIDFLLTDLVMPGGMDGVMLVREARQRRPDLKALLTTGYLGGRVPGDSRTELADLPLLPKPYTRADLARAVQEALGRG